MVGGVRRFGVFIARIMSSLYARILSGLILTREILFSTVYSAIDRFQKVVPIMIIGETIVMVHELKVDDQVV